MTGRRRPTHIGELEKADVLALLASGHSQADVCRMLDRDPRAVAAVVAEHRQAQRDSHAAEYHAIYKQAAQLAAANGDHKPALEWLDRFGAIPETSRQRTQLEAARIAADAQRDVTRHLARTGDGHGPTVNIGIGLPGQLGGVSQVTVLTSEPQQIPSKTGQNGPTLTTLHGQVLDVVDKA